MKIDFNNKLAKLEKEAKERNKSLETALNLLQVSQQQQIHQIDHAGDLNMLVDQYEEEAEASRNHLMPFECHGMKQAPQRGVKDMIYDVRSLNQDKGGQQRLEEVEQNINEI